jgi:hypothetical protein
MLISSMPLCCVPWIGLIALIEPQYPKTCGAHKPYPLETMLRIHLLQNWFSLSVPAMEEALYETTIMRQFLVWPRTNAQIVKLFALSNL